MRGIAKDQAQSSFFLLLKEGTTLPSKYQNQKATPHLNCNTIPIHDPRMF
jgi:hypothetical protein